MTQSLSEVLRSINASSAQVRDLVGLIKYLENREIKLDELKSYEIKKLEILLKYGFSDYVKMINDTELRQQLSKFQKLIEQKNRAEKISHYVRMLIEINRIADLANPKSKEINAIKNLLQEYTV
ncbi:MAG: hypothetical protein NZ908_02010 [Candidatus Micrarchaeota archaeon]|nr:hypothetical protein [Candidatus Micrarchaeota archaeon]MCX8154540.1 hypothetical protein [Candidatus Micrarchaeota archaeon]